MRKILYFDCETTGLDPVQNDIIQLAGIIEVDGVVREEFNLMCQPWSYDNISQDALDVHGYSVEKLREFPTPRSAYGSFIRILSKHCDKFNRADKFFPAGYNGKFDLDFVANWFKKAGDNYWGSWQNWRLLDPLPFLAAMNCFGGLDLPNLKLETVANHYGIEIEAHDALSDVRATRAILRSIVKGFGIEGGDQ